MLAVLLWVLPSSCVFDDHATSGQDPQEASGAWEWVWVAGFPNPSLSADAERTFTLLADALDKEGIRWAAAGSRGFSLNVDSRDLPRGRQIVEEVAERYDLSILEDRQ